MKQINFVKTITPREQRAIQQWLHWSLLLLGISSIIMIILSSQQRKTINALAQQKYALTHHDQQYTNALARKKTINDVKTIYQPRADKIRNHLYHPKNPLTLLQSLITTTNQNKITIQSIDIQKGQLSLKGTCTQPDQPLALIKHLGELPHFNNLALTSIEKDTLDATTQETTLIFTITSAIKT